MWENVLYQCLHGYIQPNDISSALDCMTSTTMNEWMLKMYHDTVLCTYYRWLCTHCGFISESGASGIDGSTRVLENNHLLHSSLSISISQLLKAKNSNSYCSSEGRNRSDEKKYGYQPKKGQLGFRGFCPYFLLLTTLYVMFESKKLKFLLLIRRKE